MLHPIVEPEIVIPSLPALAPWELLPPTAATRPHVFPLDAVGSTRAQLFYLARAGVHHAMRHWLEETPERRRVLMPAYHHGVEVEAVRSAGAEVTFYRVDDQMRIDLEDIAKKLRAPDAAALYVTHFAGFAQPIAEARALARRYGLRVFEDCALALYSRTPSGEPLGSFGDAACFCLYKTLPLPHGGLLLADDVPTFAGEDAPLVATLHHVAGSLLSHLQLRRSPLRRLFQAARRAARATVDKTGLKVQTGAMHLTPRELSLGASPLLLPLLRRIDDELVVMRRRRNFRRLAAALDGVASVVGAPLADGACPLFVPVRIRGGDKRALMHALHAGGIDAVDFWSTGDPTCDATQFPEVAALRREILELPCHQSLDDEDIDRVARAVKQHLPHA
jgi:dTDP-4-amino-4,6-dideoxygalactose transaminase